MRNVLGAGSCDLGDCRLGSNAQIGIRLDGRSGDHRILSKEIGPHFVAIHENVPILDCIGKKDGSASSSAQVDDVYGQAQLLLQLTRKVQPLNKGVVSDYNEEIDIRVWALVTACLRPE